MTEKFPLSYHPLLPPQTLWMGSIGQNSTFFSRTASTQTNKDICTVTTCVDQGMFCQGEWGGLGSSTYFTVYRGGGPTFSRGGGVQMLVSIETHITITCDFPGGSGPPIPLWIRKSTMWQFGTNRLRRACAASF